MRVIEPNFSDNLTDILLELNHLRKLRLMGTTSAITFFQLKGIFHILESVGSARIEGNRTTISEYIEEKVNQGNIKKEQFTEIANVEKAMQYIEDSIEEGTEITHLFIRELHSLTVDTLTDEGDRTPGQYRTWNVGIQKSTHTPPEHYKVLEDMEELLEFINKEISPKYDLLKIAQAHHRFTWIHPFGNGNGRTVRLLTYALLIKYGFNVKEGSLLNPSAVFFNDRDKYYEMLAIADNGSDEDILKWSEYVLSGILEEIEKINKLLDYSYLTEQILNPALLHSKDRGMINDKEYKFLKVGIQLQQFASKDIQQADIGLTQRQTTTLISKLKKNRIIQPLEEKGRIYFINYQHEYVFKSLMKKLEDENFIGSLNNIVN